MSHSLTPCLLSSVEFGAEIAASAANYHFPGEAAAVTPSFANGSNNLWIWDIERGKVDSYLRAFDDEDTTSTWAECIWGHHPRSIFCFGPRRMKMVDLRSAAVSSAIDFGTAGFLPSGRFHGAHSPCDARMPMIITSCSSAISSWDLRYLREPVTQVLHHLEHDPPSLIASSLHDCNDDCNTNNCLSMDVLFCSSCFSYPLLHSIKLGDECTPVTVGLPRSIHGLRHAHQLLHTSRASHPDGAQSTSATTSGMCLVSNSLPKGIQTIAFFASLNGDIWLSYASNNGVKVQLGSVAPETSSHWKLSIDHNAGASFQSASENECNTNSRVNVSDDSSERSLLPLSDFQKWMTFPRMISPPVFCYVVFFKMCLTGTVDEIAVSTGHALHGNGLISPSNLLQLLPSCCLWRLELPGTWQAITDSNSSPSTLTAYDVLCATGGSPPVNYLPSTCTQLHTIPDSLASAVDTAFLHNPLAQMPLPEPAKSQPTLSAMKLFGSPVRSSQSQLSQPQVRFMDTKMHSDISRPQSQIHSDHRRSYVPPTASALSTVSTVESSSHSAPVIEDILNPSRNLSPFWSTKRVADSAARGPKRRASEGF